MDAIYIKNDFNIDNKEFKSGELYVSSVKMNHQLKKILDEYVKRTGLSRVYNAVKFINLDDVFKLAKIDTDFYHLLIMRYGGIGDLIALSSIIDYFDDKDIHFVTQEKYFPVFEWFENKPKLYSTSEPIFKNIKLWGLWLNKWARFKGEGIIEKGDRKNWFELFFEFIGENDPGEEFLRPQLKIGRINDNKSNIQKLGHGRPSILICNKATASMRTCYATDIVKNIENRGKFDIFVYEINLDKNEKIENAIVIPSTDYSTFFLDCFDADMVISVDTGALHFREGVNKPAIGLYNSFTTDSRTKYYEYTKSFDLKSDCEMQPCFIHENFKTKYCPKGNGMFAPPCFNSKYNQTLDNQLKEIFKSEL